MEPDAGNPLEAEGVLNPGAARGLDRHLYLFPRLVARGNYSRIGIARVRFNDIGDPSGVERLGVVLEPEADYERRPDGGGCEDPRITFLAHLRRYVMTYTAFGPRGPRIALAVSEDLFRWQKVGLATFRSYDGLDFNGVDNKDALVFPVPIPDPHGQSAMAIIHRPLFSGTHPHETARQPRPRPLDLHRESIWISYCPTAMQGCEPHQLCHFDSHHRLAAPVASWERLKIGGGAPPIQTPHGWLVLYHGISQAEGATGQAHKLQYSAGVFVLSEMDPRVIRYRSQQPVLTPELPEECADIVANVVFPTAIDRRADLGAPNRFDVYYGMADSRIGVVRLDLPTQLPREGRADPSAKEA